MAKFSDSRSDMNRCSFCDKLEGEVNNLISGNNGALICDRCISLCYGVIFSKDLSSTISDVPSDSDLRDASSSGYTRSDLPTPSEIYKALDEYVVGQEKTKKILSVAVYNHYKRLFLTTDSLTEELNNWISEVEIEKSNILLIGPTGCGKTLLAQTLARILNVPFAIADATALTEAGYVGEDVETIIQKLLHATDLNVKRAEMGIIYIDEIDKISRKGENPSITRDVSGEGVQQALLKLIEGTVASVPPQGGRKHPNQDFVNVNTGKILFICGGAFEGLVDIIKRRINDSSIGFVAQVQRSDDSKALGEILSQVEPEDLFKYGLIPEIVGRLPICGVLNDLDRYDLTRVLTEPKNALIKQFQYMFYLEGVKLEFEEDSIGAIVDMTIKKKTGARGLRSILENALLDLMYKIPGSKDIKGIRITKDYIIGIASEPVYL